MKTKLFKTSSILLMSAVLFVTSCDEEERISAQDTEDISEEALTDSYFQDVDDMAAVAIQAPSETEFNGGREKTTIEVTDGRFRCDGSALLVTFERLEGSTPTVPKGRLIVDFGQTGCTDPRSNVRKGKLIITFSGRRFVSGSTVITTVDGYSINDVELQGVRTLTNVSSSTTEAPKFRVVLENGVAKFADGREATRESDITWQWIRAATPADDQLIIDQSSTASGTTRNDRDYVVTLLDELVYRRFCGIAVSGIKKYVIDNEKEITIDYGDGTCDRSVTVTVNGVTRNVSID
jgi:hypothetical protein